METAPEPSQPVLSAPSTSTINKRKYEEAITLLDEAAGTRALPALELPPPPKRARISLYSTLAKYGIGTTVDHKSSSMSNLQNVLKRVKGGTDANVEAEDPAKKYATYDPDSRADFLARLQTFKLVTYSSKPSQIDAVAAARCGWFNEGKEQLTCKTCKVTWTMPPRPMSNKEELASLVSQQQAMLVDQHSTSCPWKVRQSEETIYAMPIPSPSSLLTSILQKASRLQPSLDGISVKHPLTAHQTSILVSAVGAAQSDAIRKAAAGVDKPMELSFLPDETATIVAFFGWDRHTASTSRLSASSTPNASLSRISSGLATPRASASDKIMISCQLCQRQVGLWSFSTASKDSTLSTPGLSKTPTGRQFDVLREHRPHCPFVVKTTYLPAISLPSKDPEAATTAEPLPFVEGWKALMSVVSRAQSRRAAGNLNPFGGAHGSLPTTPRSENMPLDTQEEDVPSDQVSEIVRDVKSRHGGGRDLLRFVKGLLG